jgi:phosphate starvation-inducible protein PhoH and related proteins
VSQRLADRPLPLGLAGEGTTPAVQELELAAAPEVLRSLFGAHNENLKAIERGARVQIGQRGSSLRVEGPRESVDLVARLISDLVALLGRGANVGLQEIEQSLRLLRDNPGLRLDDLLLEPVLVSSRNRAISPKGLAQKAYIRAIRERDIVFGLGPAGTGKTYLAMATAVAALAERRVKRIVLARPAVEAGERLGFLPGDLAEKVNPYLRPLYDALNEMMDEERAASLIERGVVEVAPLAFMRGRTLNDAFVILDEAQNTSSEQMKMFLTRLGFSSQAVITGDPTQTDLPPGQTSGLLEAVDLLQGIEGIGFIYFSEQDVVRHPLVRKVIQAYERKR